MSPGDRHHNRKFGRLNAEYTDQDINQTNRHTVKIDRMLAHVPISAREQAIADAQLRYVLHTYGRDRLRDMYYACANDLYLNNKSLRPQYRHGLRRKYYEPKTLRRHRSDDARASTRTLLSDVGTIQQDHIVDRYADDKTGLFPDPRHAIYLAGKELREAQRDKIDIPKARHGSFEHTEARLRCRAAEKEFRRLIALDTAVERHLSDQIGRHLVQDWAARHAKWIMTGNARLEGEKYHHVDKHDHLWAWQHGRGNNEPAENPHEEHPLPELIICNGRVYISDHRQDCFCNDCVNFNKVHQQFGFRYAQNAHRKYEVSKRKANAVKRPVQDPNRPPVKVVDGKVVNPGQHSITEDPYPQHRALHRGQQHGVADPRLEYACAYPGCHAATEGYLGMLMFNFIRRGELHRFWPRRQVQRHGELVMNRRADPNHERMVNDQLLERMAWSQRPQQPQNVARDTRHDAPMMTTTQTPHKARQQPVATPAFVPPQPLATIERERGRGGTRATTTKPVLLHEAKAQQQETRQNGVVSKQQLQSPPPPVRQPSPVTRAVQSPARDHDEWSVAIDLGQQPSRSKKMDPQTSAGQAVPSVSSSITLVPPPSVASEISQARQTTAAEQQAGRRAGPANQQTQRQTTGEGTARRTEQPPPSQQQRSASPQPSEVVTVIQSGPAGDARQEAKPPVEKPAEQAAENVVATRVVAS